MSDYNHLMITRLNKIWYKNWQNNSHLNFLCFKEVLELNKKIWRNVCVIRRFQKCAAVPFSKNNVWAYYPQWASCPTLPYVQPIIFFFQIESFIEDRWVFKKNNWPDSAYVSVLHWHYFIFDVIDQQGMLTPPWHLIPPLIYSEVRVRPFSDLYFQ